MKLASLSIGGIVSRGEPDIYISGDDDETTDDIRITFVTGWLNASVDLTPQRLKDFRKLIGKALKAVEAGKVGCGSEEAW